MKAFSLALFLLFTVLTTGIKAIREVNEAQRAIIENLQLLMPNIVQPTLPLSQLLQQRANVKYLTKDVHFQNIECARDNKERILCGIYITYHEMRTNGWVDALMDTIDAADDALAWRAYSYQDFFILYKKEHMVGAPEATRLECLFQQGVPIYSGNDWNSGKQTPFRFSTDMMFYWGGRFYMWAKQQYRCACYRTIGFIQSTSSDIQSFILPYLNSTWQKTKLLASSASDSDKNSKNQARFCTNVQDTSTYECTDRPSTNSKRRLKRDKNIGDDHIQL